MSSSSFKVQFPAELQERYAPVRPLGRGGMGAVYLAEDRHLSRAVAVKVLALASDEQIIARFEREARIMGELQHPNIVQLYDFGWGEHGPYIVMEYLDGEPLTRLGRVRDPLEVMLPVAGALDAVHQRGLVHRDVKPANIMRSRSGRSVLTDFGIVYEEERTRLTATGHVAATMDILAPEQAQGIVAGPPLDWWAWGATLFYLAEGRMPFDGKELFRLAVARKPFPPHRFEAIRSGTRVHRAVDACLQPDPARRVQDLAELEAVLEGVEEPGSPSGSSTVPSRTPGPAEPAPAPAPPRVGGPAALVGVAALGLVLLGLAMRDGAGGALPGTAPGRAESSLPFPQDIGSRILEEIEAKKTTTAPPPTGVDSRAGKRLTGPREFFHPDPLFWSFMLDGIDSMDAVFDWLEAGGDPAALPDETESGLEQVDAALSGLGFPRPFGALLRPAQPPEGIPEELGEELRARLPGLPESPPPWLGRALLALVRIQGPVASMRRDLGAFADARQPGPDFPSLDLGFYRALVYDEKNLLARMGGEAKLRPIARAWFRRGARQLRQGLDAVRRSLREEPATRAQAALVGWELVEAAGPVWFGYPAFARLRHLAGGRPEGRHGALVLAGVLQRRHEPRRRAKLTPIDDPEDELLEALESAAYLRGEDPATRRIQVLVFAELAEFFERRKSRDRVPVLFRRRPEFFLGSPHVADVSRGLAVLVRTWTAKGTSFIPTTRERETVLAWIESHRKAWEAGGKDRAKLAKKLADLKI